MLAASLIVVSIFGTAASAGVIYPNDWSFETPDASASPYYIGTNTPGNWTIADVGILGSQVVNYNFPLDGYANSNVYGITGNQYLNTYSGSGTQASNRYITQTLTDTIQANTQYAFLADLTCKDQSLGSNWDISMTLSAGSRTGTPISTATILGSTIDATNKTLTTFSLPSTLPDQSLVGQALCVTISWIQVSGTVVSGDLQVDNVRINTTTTPEPSTLALLGAGLFGLLAYAWRKRR